MASKLLYNLKIIKYNKKQVVTARWKPKMCCKFSLVHTQQMIGFRHVCYIQNGLHIVYT